MGRLSSPFIDGVTVGVRPWPGPSYCEVPKDVASKLLSLDSTTEDLGQGRDTSYSPLNGLFGVWGLTW